MGKNSVSIIRNNITKAKKKQKKQYKKVLKKLGIKYKPYHKLSKSKRYKVDKALQKNRGKKRYDYLTIFEPGFDFSKFETIYDYDFNDYKFQKKYGMPLRNSYDTLYLQGLPFKALEKDMFGIRNIVEGDIISARQYILEAVYNKLKKLIDDKYPAIDIVPYEERGVKKVKRDGETYFQFRGNSELRAMGFEKERVKLEEYFRSLYNEIEDDIINSIKSISKYTFRLSDKDNIDDRYELFIIGNIDCAKNIRFKKFFSDFTKYQQPEKYLYKIVDRIVTKYKNKLNV